jgi:hypothetical protein
MMFLGVLVSALSTIGGIVAGISLITAGIAVAVALAVALVGILGYDLYKYLKNGENELIEWGKHWDSIISKVERVVSLARTLMKLNPFEDEAKMMRKKTSDFVEDTTGGGSKTTSGGDGSGIQTSVDNDKVKGGGLSLNMEFTNNGQMGDMDVKRMVRREIRRAMKSDILDGIGQ